MWNMLASLFTDGSFIPHGHCYLWKPELVSLHLLSDLLIGLAYYSIPITLIYFTLQRRDIPFNSIFLLFSAFIVACGTTHMLEIWTLWYPVYWLSGTLKALTAMVSCYTAIELIVQLPKVLALPSFAGEMSERLQLLDVLDASLNFYLRDVGDRKLAEVQRKQAEVALHQLNQDLELKIQQRTQELIQSQIALRQSEELFRKLFENAPIGIVLVPVNDQRLVKVNNLFCQMLGYSASELAQMTFEAITHPDDLAIESHLAEQATQGKTLGYQLEKRYIKKNGEVFWGLLTITTFNDAENNATYGLGMIQDITKRKESEELLRRSEEQFRTFFDTAPIAISLASVDNYRIIRVNAAHQRLFGYSASDLATMTFADFTHPDDVEANTQQVKQMVAAEGSGFTMEKRFIRKNGEIIWTNLTVSLIRDADGCPLYSMGMIEDITERKRAEESLQRSAALLQEAQQIARLGSWEMDVTSGQIHWSPEVFRIFGLDPSQPEPAYSQLRRFIHPESATQFTQLIDQAIQFRKPYEQDFRIIRADGSLGYIFSRGYPTCNTEGQVNRLFGVVMDISDRKQAETLLQRQAQREQLLRAITQRVRQSLNLDEILTTAVTEVRQTFQADRALIFCFLPDSKGKVIKEVVLPEYPKLAEGIWTDACLHPESMQHYYVGQPRIVSDIAKDEWGECLGQVLRQFGVRSKVSAPIIKNLEDGSTQVWGLLIVHACAFHRQWLPEEAALLQQISNQLAIAIQQSDLYQRVQIELTERRQAEAQLRASLEEKEVLLKEVHHRVKNNMQMVSSLLNLQADSIQDPKVLKPFIESQQRIKTMALIHEMLYQSNNLAKINFTEYIQRLTDGLFHSFRDARPHIQLTVQVSIVEVTVGTAISCGLIVNELVTNALKYAFPEGRAGEICVQFVPDSSNPPGDRQRYILSVQDNGIGLPDHINLSNTESLGFQLVGVLAQKLKGTIKLDRTKGTKLSVNLTCSE